MHSPTDPRAHASLLILEVGNSHVSVATWIKGHIPTNRRFELDQTDEAAAHALEAWEALPQENIRAVAAASVVPAVLDKLRRRLADLADLRIEAVGQELRLPIATRVDNPQQVGVDRLCSAAAAYERIRQACVTASFGTAITIDCTDKDGVFLGGAIMPGLVLQARSLHQWTAQLPEVTVDEEPVAVFGANTEQAIRQGILHGVAGAVREITERYATHLGAWPQLVATGGDAMMIRRHCDFIDNVVPNLCLQGIALAYRRHYAPWADEPS